MFLTIASTDWLTNTERQNVARYVAIDNDPRLIEIKANHPWSNALEERGGRGWAITFALGHTQLKKNVEKDIVLLSEMPVGYTLSKLGSKASVDLDFLPPNFRHKYDKKFLENLSDALDNVLKNSNLDKYIVISTTLEMIAMYAVAYSGAVAVSNLEGYEELCWVPDGDEQDYYHCLGDIDWKTEYFEDDDVKDLVYGRRKGIKQDDPLHFNNWTSTEAYKSRWK